MSRVQNFRTKNQESFGDRLSSNAIHSGVTTGIGMSYYLFNPNSQVKLNYNDKRFLIKAGALFGAAFVSKELSHLIMPHLPHSSKSLRSVEQLTLEPMLTGVIFSTSSLYDYQHLRGTMTQIGIGAGADLASGFVSPLFTKDN